MKLGLVVIIFCSVKLVVGGINRSHLMTSLLDVQKSVLDECLLCNATTVEHAIRSYNLSSIYKGKQPELHNVVRKISKSMTCVRIFMRLII